MLRITGQDERVEEWMRPIPFPRHRAERLGRRGVSETRDEMPDSIRMAESALERAQRDIDEMNRLLSGPLPFPSDHHDDDGPSAA